MKRDSLVAEYREVRLPASGRSMKLATVRRSGKLEFVELYFHTVYRPSGHSV
jgi:hypothetical protein